jgi:hypothetical protein
MGRSVHYFFEPEDALKQQPTEYNCVESGTIY